MNPITNLNELWMDAEKEAALCLCALPSHGSDYEQFRRVCEAFSLMPGHPYRLRAEEQLRVLFTIPLAPVPAFCDRIWTMTAEHLLLHPLARADAARIKAAPIRNPKEILLPEPVGRLNTVPLFPSEEEGSYESWTASHIRWLETLPDGCRTVRFRLPKGFRPSGPDLYRVGLHLSGTKRFPDLWLTQQVRFLSTELQRLGGTLLLQSACPADAVADLLGMIRRKVGLPPVLWMPDAPSDAASFESVCTALRGSDVAFSLWLGNALPAQELAAVVPIGRIRVYA